MQVPSKEDLYQNQFHIEFLGVDGVWQRLDTFTFYEFDSAVNYSEMLEFISETAYYSEQIKIKNRLPKHISKKHFERKFGKNRYYGQR